MPTRIGSALRHCPPCAYAPPRRIAQGIAMLNRRRLIALAAASALAPSWLPRSARAQAWPTRFVRLIVPFPPGGGTDAIARIVAGKLSDLWGQQMVVENRGGGATNIGTEAVVRSEADGYTLLLTSMPLAVNRFLFPVLPYDPVGDLVPVSLICDYPNIMAVPITSPAHSVAGVHRLRQRQQRQGHLRLLRPRHVGASRRRVVPPHGADGDAPHALSRRRPGAQRPHTRACRRDVQQYRRGAAADPGRQAARAGGDDAQARDSRCPTCRP